MKKKLNEEQVEDRMIVFKKICEDYATDKYTLLDCCKKYGVKSTTTFYKWRDEFPGCMDLYKNAILKAKEQYQEHLKERTLTALEQKLTATFVVEEVEEMKVIKDINEETGEEALVQIPVKIIKKKKFIPASDSVTIFMAKNLFPEQFSDDFNFNVQKGEFDNMSEEDIDKAIAKIQAKLDEECQE